MKTSQSVGFISTRFAGTDGVSLETSKWVKVLSSLGYGCFFFTGESEWPEKSTYILPQAHFNHPEIKNLNHDLFDDFQREKRTSAEVYRLKKKIKEHLHKFIEQFSPDLLIAENILSIPMNVPLGLALTEVIAELDIPTIAHHHDFYWERGRYAISGAEDYLRAAFPPTLRQIRHVVINSFAQQQLALRTGLISTLIPNVMDFDDSKPVKDAYSQDMRFDLGIQPDEHLLLQPTRVVPRKRIELSIELARRVDRNCVILISHESGDEGRNYAQYLQEYADMLGVHVIFAADRLNYLRGITPSGEKIYSLEDAYLAADLVTYPSRVEGFGNAFLETVLYRKPIVMSTYEIFKTDIQPKGFKVIGFGDYIDNECVAATQDMLHNPHLAAEMTENNYSIGQRYYSFNTLEYLLISLLHDCLGK
ncbi:MAG: glycosyltransferase family 4 protein [Chloroflexota bacterium]|nr:MAG: glycosyltransferase family 4 protein [Chloroflexota bacterium]